MPRLADDVSERAVHRARGRSMLIAPMDTDDLVDAETAFVKVAAAYSRRKGIGYGAWRAVGVSVSVLEKAGISRASG